MVSQPRSREETRFLALLFQTEKKALQFGKEDQHLDWRLPEFVSTLEQWLLDLKHQHVDKDVMRRYESNVQALRKIVDHYNDFNPKPQLLSGLNTSMSDAQKSGSDREVHKKEPINGSVNIAGTDNDSFTLQIQQRLVGKHEQHIREALLGSEDNRLQGLRHRKGPEGSELDSLLQAHHATQEQVAEEMIALTRSLKQQTQTAGDVIRKDTALIDQSNELACKNMDRLAVESDRLSEARSRFSCRCWIWLLIGIVTITFIAMIWVMKLFSKRRDMM